MKSKNSIWVTYISLFISFGLFTSFDCKKKNIKLIEATYQKSNSGIRGGATSTEYYFKLKILSSEKILFDSLWIDRKVFSPYVANGKTSVSSEAPTFSKNDTITVRVSDIQTGKPSAIANPPVNYKGSALIRYNVKGSSCYLVVKEMKLVQGVNKP